MRATFIGATLAREQALRSNPTERAWQPRSQGLLPHQTRKGPGNEVESLAGETCNATMLRDKLQENVARITAHLNGGISRPVRPLTCLPPRVHDGTPVLSDNIVVPAPRLFIDRLPDWEKKGVKWPHPTCYATLAIPFNGKRTNTA